ncbi:MAG: hypothetical protein ACI9T8_000414 [Candidatus Saccharimonadales bacterium]|jgi:hypothetical protein
MIGTNDNTQSNDDPAMLENVKQLASQPAAHVEPQTVQPYDPSRPAAPMPQAPQQTSQQPIAPALPVAQPVNHPLSTAAGQPQPPAPQSVQPYDPSVHPAPQQSGPAPMQPADHKQLAGMKQQALTHLEPLVDHIGGTPEETFRTTMMMIQANDNHTLIEKALESAKGIADDRERAQALLDIINEINYFSQNSSGGQSAN